MEGFAIGGGTGGGGGGHGSTGSMLEDLMSSKRGASPLEPKSGTGYVGMRNLGSTCYLNSMVSTTHNVLRNVEITYWEETWE